MSSYTLPQTQRNRDLAEKVTALLEQAKNMGIDPKLLTRRQGRKAFQNRGGLRTAMLAHALGQ